MWGDNACKESGLVTHRVCRRARPTVYVHFSASHLERNTKYSLILLCKYEFLYRIYLLWWTERLLIYWMVLFWSIPFSTTCIFFGFLVWIESLKCHIASWNWTNTGLWVTRATMFSDFWHWVQVFIAAFLHMHRKGKLWIYQPNSYIRVCMLGRHIHCLEHFHLHQSSKASKFYYKCCTQSTPPALVYVVTSRLVQLQLVRTSFSWSARRPPSLSTFAFPHVKWSSFDFSLSPPLPQGFMVFLCESQMASKKNKIEKSKINRFSTLAWNWAWFTRVSDHEGWPLMNILAL